MSIPPSRRRFSTASMKDQLPGHGQRGPFRVAALPFLFVLQGQLVAVARRPLTRMVAGVFLLCTEIRREFRAGYFAGFQTDCPKNRSRALSMSSADCTALFSAAVIQAVLWYSSRCE